MEKPSAGTPTAEEVGKMMHPKQPDTVEPTTLITAEKVGKKAADAIKPLPDSETAKQSLNNIIDKLDQASIAFNKPSKMTQNTLVVIELVLKPGATQDQVRMMVEVKNSATTEMTIATSEIKISEIIEAKLKGDGFDIESITNERQPISFEEETRWKWKVRPLESGVQRLFLSIDAIVNINNKEEKRTVRTFDEEILVEVADFQWQANAFIMLFIGIFIFIAISWYIFSKIKRKNLISSINSSEPQTTDNIDIFISYSRKDIAEVAKIIDALKATGVIVWLDKSGIKAGTLWSEEIVKAIQSAKVFLFIASDNAFSSDNVVKERSIASEIKLPILPVFLHTAEIPLKFQYQLSGIQQIEFTKNADAANIATIMQVLKELGVMDQP